MISVNVKVSRVNQHGKDGQLYDISELLAIADQFFNIEYWKIEVEWCQGENALEIAKRSSGGMELPDDKFRSMYTGVYQTIDGVFEAYDNDGLLARLVAVDSSFWEVSSNNTDFLTALEQEMGVYRPSH